MWKNTHLEKVNIAPKNLLMTGGWFNIVLLTLMEVWPSQAEFRTTRNNSVYLDLHGFTTYRDTMIDGRIWWGYHYLTNYGQYQKLLLWVAVSCCSANAAICCWKFVVLRHCWGVRLELPSVSSLNIWQRQSEWNWIGCGLAYPMRNMFLQHILHHHCAYSTVCRILQYNPIWQCRIYICWITPTFSMIMLYVSYRWFLFTSTFSTIFLDVIIKDDYPPK